MRRVRLQRWRDQKKAEKRICQRNPFLRIGADRRDCGKRAETGGVDFRFFGGGEVETGLLRANQYSAYSRKGWNVDLRLKCNRRFKKTSAGFGSRSIFWAHWFAHRLVSLTVADRAMREARDRRSVTASLSLRAVTEVAQ